MPPGPGGLPGRSLLASQTGTSAAAGAGAASGMSGLSVFGIAMQAAGMVSQSIGAFYSAQANRYAARAQRLNLEFAGSIADINARAAENEAAAMLEAGRTDKATSTLQFGAAKAAVRARRGASGLQSGVGSAAEVDASIEAAKEIDSLTIDRNALRAAGAASTRAVNLRNQALLSRVSAKNVHDTSQSISPGLAAFSSLLGGAGPLATNVAIQSRL